MGEGKFTSGSVLVASGDVLEFGGSKGGAEPAGDLLDLVEEPERETSGMDPEFSAGDWKSVSLSTLSSSHTLFSLPGLSTACSDGMGKSTDTLGELGPECLGNETVKVP